MSLYADWEIRKASSFKHATVPVQFYFTICKKDTGYTGGMSKHHFSDSYDCWNIVDVLERVFTYLDTNEAKSHDERNADIWTISNSVGHIYRFFMSRQRYIGGDAAPDTILEDATRAIRALKSLLGMSPIDTVKGITVEISNGDLFHIALVADTRMIYPYVEHSENKLIYRGNEIKVPSYGTSSYGYDIRLSNKFLIADDRRKPGHEHVVDCAKNNSADFYNELTADSIDLIPGGFVLAVSQEWIRVPRDVMVTCLGKSSVARDGIYAFVTPLESDWHGYVTLEIKNLSPNTVRLYAGQGIMQLLFQETGVMCEVSYADRKGKYQGQHERPVPSEY